MTATALLFNPQVHVLPGHYRDLYDAFAPVRDRLAEAADVLGVDLVGEFFSDDPDRINAGPVVRPASLAIAVALYELSGARDLDVVCAAGISLGQIAAAAATGAVSFRDAVRMAAFMATIEHEAFDGSGAGVAFYYNVDLDGLQRTMAERVAAGADLAPCAFTSDDQMIVSGDLAALRELNVAALAHGGLGVVIPHGPPAHSPKLVDVERRFGAEWTYLDPVRDPRHPLVCNLTTELLGTAEQVHAALVGQYTRTVRWSEGVHRLPGLGVTDVLVIGPGHFVRRSLEHTAVELTVRTCAAVGDLVAAP